MTDDIKQFGEKFVRTDMGDTNAKAGDETLEYHTTVSRELAEALAEHYRDDPEVGNIPDALRKAGRKIVDEAGE